MEPAQSANTAVSPRLAAIVAACAVVIGVVLRTIEFLRDRPLWLDEAMLSLNIGSRSFAELARPLDYDQTAPLLYLWLERAIVMVGGVNERSLRLLPFLAGIALMPATWFVGRRLAGATAAAVATLLVALGATLIAFGAEAKQYGVDPLVMLVVLWLACRAIDAPGDRGKWIQLAAGGVICLLASQPAVFALGGVLLALMLHAGVRRSPLGRRWIATSAIAWGVTFSVVYLALYRGTATSDYMQRFWEGTFLDPRAGDLHLRLRMFAHAAFATPLPAGTTFGFVITTAGAWLAGIWVLWLRDRVRATLVAAPLVLATGASALGLYPVMDRLYLFAAPAVLLGCSMVLVVMFEQTRPRLRDFAFGAGAVLVTIAVMAEVHVKRITAPVFYGVGKQVVADVDSMSRGDAVYVAARSFPLWIYYTTDWNQPDRERLAWAASIGGAGKAAHNNAPTRGHQVDAVEAVTLARPYRGRTEIVGLPTGRQYRTSTRTLDTTLTPAQYALPLTPDSAWSAVEVSRMAAVARPRIWVFGSHMFALDGAEPELVAELQRRGVRLLMERRQGSTVAYHVAFPAAGDSAVAARTSEVSGRVDP